MKILDALSFPLHGERLIEASAGTGKTYTITNLYLRLLLGHGDGDSDSDGAGSSAYVRALGVNEILVVTFTNAATEELRNRVRNQIVLARRGFQTGASDDDFISSLIETTEDRQKALTLLTSALQMMDEAAIFTIHGFCGRMLQENAFESGTLFGVEMKLDGDADLEIAVQDTWRQLILHRDSPAASRFLKNLWPTPARLQQDLARYVPDGQIEVLPDGTTGTPHELLTPVIKRIDALKQEWLEAEPGVQAAIENSDVNKRSYTRASLPRWIAEIGRFARDPLDLNLPKRLERFASSTLQNSSGDGIAPDLPIFDSCDEHVAHWPDATPELKAATLHDLCLRMHERKIGSRLLGPDDLLTNLAAALTGPLQHAIASRIRSLYPFALVDEFQDTDPLQYHIFRAIYGDQPELGLVIIGDPKQAIYKFRGADIYTYINAKRLATAADEGHFSLDVNWRSTAPMIRATNRLFQREDAFLNDQDIPYPEARAAEQGDAEILNIKGKPVVPLTFWHLLSDKDSISRTAARLPLMEAAAEETATLLGLAQQNQAVTGELPLSAGQIAFLVRDRRDAAAAREALRRRGIGSVLVRTDTVFRSSAAEELLTILQAASTPGNEGRIKAALCTKMIGCSADEIRAIDLDTGLHLELFREFSNYRDTWVSQGPLPMLYRLIIERQIAERLMQREGGERTLTDLRHLGELLQHRSQESPGIHQLIDWYQRQLVTGGASVSVEESQQRLESDRNLVQITTMHGAKGLEYDVVIIPNAVSGMRERSRLVHREQDGLFRQIVDFRESAEVDEQIRHEQLAEDLRIIYVSVTRAKQKCYLGLANIGGSSTTLPFEETALAHLLELGGEKQSDESIVARLKSLAEGTPCIEVLELHGPSSVTRLDESASTSALTPPPQPPHIGDTRRLISYTSLTRGVASSFRKPGAGDSDRSSTPVVTGESLTRFTYPRGARVGIMLHSLLEELDFAADANALDTAVAGALDRFGYGRQREQMKAALVDWTRTLLATPFTPPFTQESTLCLAGIGDDSKLPEMEFHFPVTGKISAEGVSRILRRHGYMSKTDEISFQELTGMMTGLIDLVFVVQQGGEDQYFLADYKSNHLGNDDDHYSSEHLRAAIKSHRYDLQYLIYTVALNRYLRCQISNYSYDVHFGGAYYLFLRGMAGSTAPGSGVFFDKPDYELVRELDELFAGTAR